MRSPPLSRRGLVAGARRPVLGIAGQILNAGTNFVTVYVASLLLAPDRFGGFVLAVSVVTVVLASGRGLLGSVMLVQLPVVDDATRSGQIRSATGFTLVVGVLASAALAASGNSSLLWFAPWITGALLQDVGRYAALAVGDPGRALLLDVVWAVVQGTVIGGGLLLGHAPTVAFLATAWGLGAFSGALWFVVSQRSVPSGPRPWLRTTRDVAGWFTAIAVVAQTELAIVLWLTGRLLGAADAGGLRAVQLLAYQPALVILGALSVLFTPMVVRVRASRGGLARASRRILMATTPVALGLVLVALFREPLMALLFPRYVSAAPLVVPIALQSVLSALAVAPLAVMRALRRGRAGFVLQIVRTGAVVSAAAGGTVLAGPAGLAWGLLAGAGVSTAVDYAAALRAAHSVGDDVLTSADFADDVTRPIPQPLLDALTRPIPVLAPVGGTAAHRVNAAASASRRRRLVTLTESHRTGRPPRYAVLTARAPQERARR